MLTLGFLGGSITGGSAATDPEISSYRALVTNWFKEQFPSAVITSINAGVGGTGSPYGAFRAYADVGKADLVFIEFAENDGFGQYSEKIKVMQYTEGIVRRLYLANPEVEIVFVDMASQHSAPDYQNGSVPHVVNWHRLIADHYTIAGLNSILYINPGENLVRYIRSGNATWTGGNKPMTTDGTHPNDSGHRFYADKIIVALQKAMSSYTPLPAFDALPVPLSPKPVQNGKLIDISMGKNNGNWIFSSKYATATEIGATIDFMFKGQYIGIKLTQQIGGGSFEAWIDGGEKKRFSTKAEYDREFYEIVSDHESEERHTLHVVVDSLPVTLRSFMVNP